MGQITYTQRITKAVRSRIRAGWNCFSKDREVSMGEKCRGYSKPCLLPMFCPDHTLTEKERLNAYHRRQLKKILNIRYPNKIANKSLYRICQEKPLSLQILSARWSHILRRDKEIPVSKATRAYLIPNSNKLRGRPKKTLPIVFNRDLALIQNPIRLHSSKDMAEITDLAKDRKYWRRLTSQIEKAAEMSQTKSWDAKRQ